MTSLPPEALVRLRDNLARARSRIAEAARRAGRDPAEVTLVAVTKSVDAEVASALADLGILDLAENRVQPAREKLAALAGRPVRWHFVGPLQRNKAKEVAGRFSWFHALDSIPLAEELDRRSRAVGAGAPLRCLVEVNVAAEPQKHGFSRDATADAILRIRALPGLCVEGLMTLPPAADDPEAARPHFRALRVLRDRIAADAGKPLPHLSMGMSADFPVAVEEGSTLVRLGRTLFEGV